MKGLIKTVLKEYVYQINEAKRFVTYEMNDESFARVFFLFLQELKENEGFSYSKMKKSFELAIRMWTEKPPKLISKKVIDHFIANHPGVNPFTAKYRPRNKWGVEVIFEHTTPVNNFVRNLLQSENLEQVKQVMNEYSGMSIITLEEDKCLFRSGLSRQRPQGWRQAYESCGIEIMDENQYNNYKQKKVNFQTQVDEQIDFSKKVDYSDLNPKEKEEYNFAKIASRLADYGYRTFREPNDWGGADFYCVARQCDLGQSIKVQQKGRLTFDKKYLGKDLHIVFHDKLSDTYYLYNHDELLLVLLDMGYFKGTTSWDQKGLYTIAPLSKNLRELLEPYKF